MNFYSQKKYNDVLGSCRDTIKQSGCFLTSLCNLNLYLKFYKIVNPSELNDVFTHNNIWVQGCLISGPKIASFFKLEYLKKTNSDMLCICETDHFKKVGVPQHFFLYNPEKKERVDPLDLDPQWEPNNYNIISYRIFKTMQPEVETMQNKPKLGTPTDTYAETPLTDLSGGTTSPVDEFEPEVATQSSYQELTSFKSQFLQLLSSLWSLLKNLFKP
jgi:hypothetical protein